MIPPHVDQGGEAENDFRNSKVVWCSKTKSIFDLSLLFVLCRLVLCLGNSLSFLLSPDSGEDRRSKNFGFLNFGILLQDVHDQKTCAIEVLCITLKIVHPTLVRLFQHRSHVFPNPLQRSPF